MGAWTDHVVPRLADATARGDEIGELRREACAPLSGRVLEPGFGSADSPPVASRRTELHRHTRRERLRRPPVT